MLRRAGDLLKFQLERLLLRGTAVRLLIMVGFIGLVSVVGGQLAMAFGNDDLEGSGQATWWAFLRLSDPGYLGDDVGLARRIIATVLTVLGYVLFMGSLVAIMTQWLNQTLRELESGHTRIVQRDHILVIGWTSRTATILSEMLRAERGRVRRFLAPFGTRRLRLVLLVEDLSAALRYELREKLGPLWQKGKITMRSGSALSLEHLRRVDFMHAAAILMPAEDWGPKEAAWDARTIKTLLSMAKHLDEGADDELPLVVTEIFDADKVAIARRTYHGPLEVVPSDLLIGRLQSLIVLHPGISLLFEDMLAYGDGSQVHVVEADDLVGKTLADLARHFPRAVPLGFARPEGKSFQPILCPRGEPLRQGDRLVLLARSHEDATAEERPMPKPKELPLGPPRSEHLSAKQRILVLGWSDRVPDLVSELAAHHAGDLQVDVLSALDPAEREAMLAQHEIGAAVVRNLEGDVLRPQLISHHCGGGYDCVVLVSSDWVGTGSQSDARTIMTYLLVADALTSLDERPRVVVELVDENSRDLFDDPEVEVLVSPLVLGRVLAHVTLRKELAAVYEDIFDAVGPVVAVRSPGVYGLGEVEASFAQLEQALATRGDVLLGMLRKGGHDRLALNPDKSSRWAIDASIDLVVLTAGG